MDGACPWSGNAENQSGNVQLRTRRYVALPRLERVWTRTNTIYGTILVFMYVTPSKKASSVHPRVTRKQQKASEEESIGEKQRSPLASKTSRSEQ